MYDLLFELESDFIYIFPKTPSRRESGTRQDIERDNLLSYLQKAPDVTQEMIVCVQGKSMDDYFQ